ncbi:MAG: AAA family ATPase [Crocosphaera sp.]|nr:AAA family ATPase [Crocosphaera sp.]
MTEDIIAKIYNSFHPFISLQPGDYEYVDCQEVRGDTNIFNEVGKKIIRSDQFTCQLYTGHLGGGKTTELLRLKEYLEKNGCFVVYFAATEGDIDQEDAEYTDILLGCTRHILEELKDYSDPAPLLNWLKQRWKSIKYLFESTYEFDKLTVNRQIGLFTKLTASIRRIPSQREKIRKQVDIHSISLIEALNQFIEEAVNKLPNNQCKLVVIADNLDRITPIIRNNGNVNHDEIFINHSTQLKSLNCHVIYTVPIFLVYSNRATELRNLYGTTQVLPMIMVRDKNNQIYERGIEILQTMITRRITSPKINVNLDFEQYYRRVFDQEETCLKLCLMTGGHIRELMLFMQTAMDYIDTLPITKKAVNRALNEARDNTYRNAVDSHEWKKLVSVSKTKNIQNEEEYRSLLFRRCVLEYREYDEKGENKRWYDVHPLIKEIDEFKTSQI